MRGEQMLSRRQFQEPDRNDFVIDDSQYSAGQHAEEYIVAGKVEYCHADGCINHT